MTEIFQEFCNATSEKMNKLGVNLPDAKVHAWCVKTMRMLTAKTQKDVHAYYFQEYLHYVTPEEIMSGDVNVEPDLSHVQLLFKNYLEEEKETTTDKPGSDAKPPLQTPDETFNMQIKGAVCPACKSDNTLTFARQTRSADEPTNFFSQCSDCNRCWRQG